MSQFHINIGHRFKKPDESRYSLLRRCLSSNLGIPYSVINKQFKDELPDLKNIYERIVSVQHDYKDPKLIQFRAREEYEEYSHRRQCPECAKEGYHSDIFAIPSLALCPIHHCALTDTCPTCKEKWPDKEDITKRSCHTCGVIPYDVLTTKIQYPKYEAIKKTIDLYTYKPIKQELSNFRLAIKTDRTNERRWWSDISINSAYYPAYLMFRNEYTSKQMKSLGVEHEPLSCISSPLKKISRNQVAKIIKKGDGLNLDISQLDKELLRLDYEVMSKILSVIHEISPSHSFHICKYSNLDIRSRVDHPPFCEYCAAMSLWFLQVACMKFGRYYSRFILSFPYPAISEFPVTFSTSIPFVTDFHQNYYITNTSVRNWFYKRGLEILFEYIFHYICKSKQCIKNYQKSKSITAFYIDEYYDFSGNIIIDTVINKKIYLHYNNINPIISAVYGDKRRKLDSSKGCEAYHKYMVKNLMPRRYFYEQIDYSSFDYKTYKSLNNKLILYLKDMV